MAFQSSRHRVKRCNRTELVEVRESPRSFSPLVIESSGATPGTGPRIATCRSLSVLSSSSQAVQLMKPGETGTYSVGLSVLSSSSQAVQPWAIYAPSASTTSSFQSSRHRVKRCNVTPDSIGAETPAFQSSRHRVKRCNRQVRVVCQHLRWDLSVLSSSSQAVQQAVPGHCDTAHDEAFSPLVIESSGATLGEAAHGAGDGRFQSSRHRVKRCNAFSGLGERHHVVTFSPLVIESSGATARRCALPRLHLETFSPLVIESSGATRRDRARGLWS